ncbi:VanZ family protein [Bacillus sp. RO3]|nr:VanZ family protein [Bacillus sp. RO3]
MRYVLAIFYGIFVWILTCTESIEKLFREGRPSFLWNPDPDLKSFLDFDSYPFDSPAYLTQKSGHIMAFYLLAFFTHSALRKASVVFILSASFGLFTEASQLFFSRTGCLLDVGYDVMGITLYFIFQLAGQKRIENSSRVRSG